MSTDPVCGMEVFESSAPAIEVEGVTYYFCSWACLGAFQDNPEKYLNDTSDSRLQRAA